MRYFFFGLLVCSLLSCKREYGKQEVYVCSGKYAQRYHSTTSCEGLDNCQGVLEPMTVSEAKASGKTACHLCW